MRKTHWIRYPILALILIAGVYWSFAEAQTGPSGGGWPQSEYLADGAWLQAHLNDQNLVVVDVRRDKNFDDRVIPGAVRMPWDLFRYNSPALGVGGLFVGVDQAQEILGRHGLTRGDTIVLYDSVASDGGATASYVFWVLDLLGHKNMKILDRGIDGWVDSGGTVDKAPRKPEPQMYQALPEEMALQRLVDGRFIEDRLGDPYYQVLDVRSVEEYAGEKPNTNLEGKVLKLGHIPTAYNIPYQSNWTDGQAKSVKNHAQLIQLYQGLDPNRAVIAYCHSARRGSYGYYILRLMGFKDVRLYDRSWFEWGNRKAFYPVETMTNTLSGVTLRRGMGIEAPGGGAPAVSPGGVSPGAASQSGGTSSGYISCGG